MRLEVRLIACARDQALEHRHARAYELERSQPIGPHVEEDDRPIMLERALDQPRAELRQVVETGPTETQRLHGLGKMVASRLLTIGVLVDGEWTHLELAREIGHDRRWRCGQVVRDEAEKAERTELEREAEAVGVAAPSSNARQVVRYQRVVRDEISLE